MNRTLRSISEKSNELHKVNGVANSWDTEPVQNLSVIVSFFKELITELDKREKPFHYTLRIKDKKTNPNHSIYDTLAKQMYAVI
ncbi:TPA: hypothetical protein ACLFZR_004891, partial [Enterobacter cloacae]